MAQQMQEQIFTTPAAQQPQMMTTGGPQNWLGSASLAISGAPKKRRSEKSFPGIPKGYWWTPLEAAEAKSKGQYIKVNGGNRSSIPSKPQPFSFEATVLKGAPYKKRTDRRTGAVNELAYSGQGLHVAYLDTINVGDQTILARLSGDPRDIATALILANQINPDGVPFLQRDEASQLNFIGRVALDVIAQSYNYYTIVERQGQQPTTLVAMDTWDRLKNTSFYRSTSLYIFLSDASARQQIDARIPGDLFQRFVAEAQKRISDKDGRDARLDEFQGDVFLYIFLSHHIRGPNCAKIGPDGHPIEPYTLPGNSRKHSFAVLLSQVYNDPQHVIDISSVSKNGNYRKAKTPKLNKDKTTRAKGVPVNFQVVINGAQVPVIDKVYSNNEASVSIALKELGLAPETIAVIKTNVGSQLLLKHQAKMDKRRNPLPGVLQFQQKGASCQVTHYSTAPAVSGVQPQSNVAANVEDVLGGSTVGSIGGEM